jgi:hypothetical protein
MYALMAIITKKTKSLQVPLKISRSVPRFDLCLLISIGAVAGQTAGDFVENVEFHLAVTGPSLNSVK